MSGEAIHLTQWSRLGGSDPTVVLVHGSAQGSMIGGDRHFSAQSRLGVRGWRVIAPDRPGHGRSPAPGRPDDPQVDGRWVADLLGEGGHLVGHSFGGAVALAATTLRPRAVRSLTLIEPALHNVSSSDPDILRWRQAVGQIYATAASPGELAARFGQLVAIPAGLLGRAASEDPGDEAAAELDRIGQALRVMKLPSEAEIRRDLETVRTAGIPLLVVTGGHNPGIDATGRLSAELGGGRHVVIQSDHHFPHLVSDDFNDVLAEAMNAAERERRALAS